MQCLEIISTKVRSRQTRAEVVVVEKFRKSVLTCRFDGKARPTVGMGMREKGEASGWNVGL